MDILHDARHAFRSMMRRPGFAVVTILILALGTGLGTAVFSVVNGVLLNPLPFDEPERIAVCCW